MVKWVRQSVNLITFTKEPVRLINTVARVCYMADVPEDNHKQHSFIKKLIEQDHTSPLEFVDFIWFITTSRSIANELVRHRMASYMQESTRYVKYSMLEMVDPRDEQIKKLMNENIYSDYESLIKAGVPKQYARDVLPLGFVTHIYCKMNLREFRHFLKLRMSKSAHPLMHELGHQMLISIKRELPDADYEALFHGLL